MISYKAKNGCDDLREYTDPLLIMRNFYSQEEEGFTDLEMKRNLSKKGFLLSRGGVCALRAELNKQKNFVVNVNAEKRDGMLVWRLNTNGKD